MGTYAVRLARYFYVGNIEADTPEDAKEIASARVALDEGRYAEGEDVDYVRDELSGEIVEDSRDVI